jgi:hypothetical protein
VVAAGLTTSSRADIPDGSPNPTPEGPPLMNALARVAVCVTALFALSLSACTHPKSDAAKSAGSDATIHVNPGGPGNTPTSVRPSGTVPKHFWVNYEFEPAGRRDWVNAGKGKWEERWASGTVVKYMEDGPFDTGGYNGIMVHPEAGGDYVLLPYGGVGAMLRTRPTKTARNWSYLAEIAGVVKQ